MFQKSNPGRATDQFEDTFEFKFKSSEQNKDFNHGTNNDVEECNNNFPSENIQESVEFLEKSTLLLNTAHKCLTESRNVAQRITEERSVMKLKKLQRKLNNAMLLYDTNTTAALVDFPHHQSVYDDEYHLASSMESLRTFVDEQANLTLPLSLHWFKSIADDLVKRANSGQIKEMESILQCIENFQEDLKGLSKDESTFGFLYEELEGFNMVSTQLLRHANDLCLQKSSSEREHASLKFMAEDWANLLFNVIEKLFKYFRPLSCFKGEFFRRTTKEVGLFKTFNTNLINLTMSCCQDLTYLTTSKEEYSLHLNNLNNAGKSVRVNSEKLMQMVKKNILGHNTAQEWFALTSCFLHWLYYIYNLLKEFNIMCHAVHSQTWSAKQILAVVTQWKHVAVRSMESCSCEDSIAVISKHCKYVITTYEDLRKCSKENTSVEKRCNRVLLEHQLKLKIFNLSTVIYLTSHNISKPLDALIISVSQTFDPMHISRHTPTDSPEPFYSMDTIFYKKMERIRIHTCLAVDKVMVQDSVHDVILTLDRLDAVTEEILSLCRHSVENQERSVWSHYTVHLLRFKWISIINSLLTKLRKLTDVRYLAIAAIMRHLHTADDVSHPAEFLDVMAEKPASYNMFHGSVFGDFFSKHSEQEEIDNGHLDGLKSQSHQSIDQSEQATDQSHQATDQPIFTAMANDVESSSIDTAQFSLMETTPQLIETSNPINDHKLNSNDIETSDLSQNTADTSELHLTSSCKNNNSQPYIEQIDTKLLSSNDALHVGSFEVVKKRQPPVVKPKPSIKCKSIPTGVHSMICNLEAVYALQREVDQWDEANNSIVQVVKLMSQQMFDMAEYSNGRGKLKCKEDFIRTAKSIADNAKTVASFASLLSSQCSHEGCREQLLYFAERVPTLSTQLKIVAGVKTDNEQDDMIDVVLIKNAENLMHAVVGTLNAAENASASIEDNPNYVATDTLLHDGKQLIFDWKRKSRLQRVINLKTAAKDELGLRKIKVGSTGTNSLKDLASCE